MHRQNSGLSLEEIFAAAFVVILFTTTCLHAQPIRRFYVAGEEGYCCVLDQLTTGEIVAP